MFPVPSRDNRLMFNPALSPSDRHHTNKSTHLPYFKRFPNSKFMSQERKRKQKFEFFESSTPQKQTQHRGSFFKKQKSSFDDKSSRKDQSKAYSSSILKIDKDFRKKRMIKQFYEREGTKMRQKTQCSQDYRKNSMNKTKTQAHSNSSQIYAALSPLEVIKGINNLQPYEKQQIMNYTEIYYFGQNCSKKHQVLLEMSKPDGSYNWLTGDHINFRYEFVEIMGEGSFGEVFKCVDHRNGKKLVALKIVKNNEKYLNQAKTEIKILNFIKAKDSSGTKNCVHLKDFFQFRSRVCMVFDLMSLNLYELIKNNGFYGLPLDLIRRMALQMLNALHFLHKNQIIHADLKPQNILLKEANKSGIKIIDFGSSCFEKQTIYTYIQSRYYRAPEVILGLPYNRKIDIWSFACIIAQLHLGYPLFAGDEEHEQMCLVIEVMGLPPAFLSYSAKRWEVFFDKHNHLKPHPKRVEPNSKQLHVALQKPDDLQFIDFVKICLSWTAQDRPEALQCLKHPWILKGLPEQIKQQHLRFIAQEEENKLGNTQRKVTSISLQNRNKLFHEK